MSVVRLILLGSVLSGLHHTFSIPSSMSNNSDASTLDFYHPQYKEAVYVSLFTGMVYGEGQETRRYLSNF
jgi:hypothetical protein